MCLHDLPQRPECDAVAVRQATALAPEDELILRIDEGTQLRDEAALADSGLAHDREEMTGRLAQRAPVHLPQNLQLVVTANERRRTPRLRIDAETTASADREPERDRGHLPFRLNVVQLVVLDRLSRRPVRLLADHKLTRRRRRLESCRRVDDVTGDDALAELGASVERDDGLAGVDGCSRLEAELSHCAEDRDPAAYAPLRVVLMRNRRTEDGHHCVADELLDRAAEPLDLCLRTAVIRLQAGAHIFGISGLGGCCEADEVDKEHRDHLPLLPRRPRVRLQERVAADHAETCPLGVLLAATPTDSGHARSLGARRRCAKAAHEGQLIPTL